MKHKPWPLIVLAVLHFLAPFGNIISNSLLLDVSILTYTRALLSSSEWLKIFIFMFAPILGGLLIYICKKWSYYLYLSLMLVPLFYCYFYWTQHPSLKVGLYLFVIYPANLLMVIYFMLPQVRQVYFDRRLRWWETKPRFKVDFETEIVFGEQKTTGEIKNISEDGLFVESNLQMKKMDTFDINFNFMNQLYPLKGQVVYSKNSNNRIGYGIVLLKDKTTTEILKKLIHTLNEQGLIMKSRLPTEEDSFVTWIKRLLRQKKGLFPEK